MKIMVICKPVNIISRMANTRTITVSLSWPPSALSKLMFRHIEDLHFYGLLDAFCCMYTERQKNRKDFWIPLKYWMAPFDFFKMTLTSINLENLFGIKWISTLEITLDFVDVFRFAMWKWIHFIYVNKF